MIISKDGSFHPCCNDWDQVYSIAKTESSSILEAWNSEKLNALRQINLDGELDEHPMCKNCFVPESYIWRDADTSSVSVDEVNAFGRKRSS